MKAGRASSETGAALVAVAMIMAMLTTLAVGFMANFLYESTDVTNRVRDAQAFYLSETALSLLPHRLAREEYGDFQETFYDPVTLIGGFEDVRDVWGGSGDTVFSIGDPSLVRGEFELVLDDNNHPTLVDAVGRVFYTVETGVEQMEERTARAKIGWLAENFEYPLFLGDSSNKDDILFSLGSAPGLTDNDSLTSGLHGSKGRIEGGVSLGEYEMPGPSTFDTSAPFTAIPLGLREMNYEYKNYTHYVDFDTMDNPDFLNILKVNPGDWRRFVYLEVGPRGYLNAFFPAQQPNIPFRQSEAVNLGTDRIYYVDGHVWFLHPWVNTLTIKGRATIVAKGNIYIYNNLVYDDPQQDMLVLIALGDQYRGSFPMRFGNIFVSDPFMECVYEPQRSRVSTVDAFLFAARDFFYNVNFVNLYVLQKIQFNVDPYAAAPFPFEGLRIFGGLTVQGLGAGYQRGSAYGRRLRPYIRRDSYCWRDGPDPAGDVHFSSAFFYQDASDPANAPMWYGEADRDNKAWSTTDWPKLDGSGPVDCDNSTGAWHCWADEHWVYDDNSTGSLAYHADEQTQARKRLKKYDPDANTVTGWEDSTGAHNVASPILHIPFTIVYDSRIRGIDQPPGLPEDDDGSRRIANVHVTQWREIP